jgi:hypothetical protein
MRHGGHSFGTRHVGSFDTAAMREGLASPGMDTRYWISRGTVGTMGDDGTFDATDPNAIWTGPEGVECDVKLEPLEQMVTALWSKGSAECSDISPIRPGDQVVVENPGGDLMSPVIIALVHSRGAKQPMTAGVPIFDNKRRLIYQATTDLDIRCVAGKASIAAGPTSMWVKQDQVQLGAENAAHPVMQGDSWQSAINAFLTKLGAALMTVAPVATDSGELITALNSTDIPKLISAAYLSANVKTT